MEEVPKNYEDVVENSGNDAEVLSEMPSFEEHMKSLEKAPNSTADDIYREIAKDALMNWNGLSAEEANEKVKLSSFEELEKTVGANSSIRAAIHGIMKSLETRKLVDDEEMEDIGDDLEWGLTEHKGPENFDVAIKNLSKKLESVDDKERFVLDVLDNIHENWIEKNMNKLNDPKRVNKRYQFMPLSIIGFKEAKADLLFVQPILETAGMKVDQDRLKDAYENYDKNLKELFSSENRVEVLDDTYNNIPQLEMGLENPEYGISFAKPTEYVMNRLNFLAQYHQFSKDEDFVINTKNVEGNDSAVAANLLHEPTEWDYAVRYAAEIANQVIDKVNNK